MEYRTSPQSDVEASAEDKTVLDNPLLEGDERIIGRAYDDLPQPRVRRHNGFLREIVETLLLVVAIYSLVNLSTARFVVEGSSMEPNFHSGEYIIVSRLAYILSEPERGDVVVFHYDEENNRDFIKRIVGLPGEVVEIREGRVYINGILLKEPYVDDFCRVTLCPNRTWPRLDEDEYFVLGDNRNSSQDSHDFGPIQRDQIIGRAWIRYWPLENGQIIPHHDYGLPEELPIPTPTPIPTAPPDQLPDTNTEI